MNPHDENVLTMSGNKAHHQRRAHLLAGYGGKGMDNQEQLVDEQIERLIELVEREYLSTHREIRPCNLARTMQYLTQDVITALGFGEAVGYLDINKMFSASSRPPSLYSCQHTLCQYFLS